MTKSSVVARWLLFILILALTIVSGGWYATSTEIGSAQSTHVFFELDSQLQPFPRAIRGTLSVPSVSPQPQTTPRPPSDNVPPGKLDAPTFSNIKDTRLRISWTAPTAGSSAITRYGLQYKLSSEADDAFTTSNPSHP